MSIQKVADIVGEISTASREQAAGVHQVGEAVTQMDTVTQQNAALVEEMAAAASSLKQQAEELVQEVAVFKVPEMNKQPELFQPREVPKKKLVPAVKSSTVKPVVKSVAPTEAKQSRADRNDREQDWETF